MNTTRSSLVVHHYAPKPKDVKSGESSSLPQEELLSRGRNLISSVESSDGWRAINPPSDPSLNLGQELAFKKVPPPVSSLRYDFEQLRSVEQTKNKEGDVVAGGKQTFAPSELQAFEGTDFLYLLHRTVSAMRLPIAADGEENTSRKEKRKRLHDDLGEAGNVEGQSKDKRRPVVNRKISLHDLIPHPHHYTYSPVGATITNQRPNLDITKHFSPYSKSPFIPIAPFITSKVELFFKDTYARSAWVIPVSGKSPWKDASSATLVDNKSLRTPQAGQSSVSRLSITWSPFVINKFWSDLLEIRKQGVLGAISLSFHVASTEKSEASATKATTSSHPRRKTATDRLPAGSYPKSLDQCTYIKVYQDARYAMYVRSVLDAWRTEIEVEETCAAPRVTRSSPRRNRSVAGTSPTSSRKKFKIRALQGANLVLLDETSQAVGLC